MHILYRITDTASEGIEVDDPTGTGLSFDFLDEETFEPHADAARPSSTVQCLDAHRVVHADDDLPGFAWTATGHGDTILFLLPNYTLEEDIADDAPQPRVLFSLQWKEGSVHAVRVSAPFTDIWS